MLDNTSTEMRYLQDSVYRNGQNVLGISTDVDRLNEASVKISISQQTTRPSALKDESLD